MNRFSDGFTGHLFEEKILGICRAPYRGYMRWPEAMEVVRKNQPPLKAPTAARLEREVGRQVGGVVKFRTAVGSAMDFYHGVDGFFEFKGFVVTIDLTLNPHKKDCCSKADMIVYKDDLVDLPMLAGRIARELQSKTGRRG